MITLDEMETMLNEIAESLPKEIYKGLNGGIVLLPESKENPIGRSNDLYILGEYHGGGMLGRYITIYYGSFMRVFGSLGREEIKQKLMHTLKHEFVHHLESMAGERDLEIEDAKFISDYLRRKDID
ncbi:MAG: metallopeptidase family protein [Dethiosulfatibacter sp.]|nr:metallopeptidase family protein [Dethiosulfatibacter sp.]